MTRSQRIPMASISALTFTSNAKTTGRRLSPIPQLRCSPSSLCSRYQPPAVQCVQVGAGSGQWKCEADLPSGMGLGRVEVSCEGWDGPDDPYVLKGSCGLEYQLVKSGWGFEDQGPSSYLPSSYGSSFSWPNLLSLLLLLYALYTLFSALLPRLVRRFPSLNRPTFPGGWGGGGWPWGGGGGGGWGGGPGFGGGPGGPPPPYSKTPQEGWQPGFWTGLATGAAALQGANYLRNRNADNGQRYRGNAMGYGGGLMGDQGVGGSGSWGNRGGAATGGSGGMGPMRSSTGFGGTRNR